MDRNMAISSARRDQLQVGVRFEQLAGRRLGVDPVNARLLAGYAEAQRRRGRGDERRTAEGTSHSRISTRGA